MKDSQHNIHHGRRTTFESNSLVCMGGGTLTIHGSSYHLGPNEYFGNIVIRIEPLPPCLKQLVGSQLSQTKKTALGSFLSKSISSEMKIRNGNDEMYLDSIDTLLCNCMCTATRTSHNLTCFIYTAQRRSNYDHPVNTY